MNQIVVVLQLVSFRIVYMRPEAELAFIQTAFHRNFSRHRYSRGMQTGPNLLLAKVEYRGQRGSF